MAEGLFDPYQKLRRANDHLADFKALLDRERADTHSHRVVVNYDPQDGCHYAFLKTYADRDLPSQFGLILGDIVNNARGALDIVAWQLAVQHLGRDPTEQEAKKIQFPIARDAGHFASSSVLDYVSTDAGKEMGKHQPPPGVADAPLALLNWISKRDKHRVIVAGVAERRLGRLDYLVPKGFRIANQEPISVTDQIALFQRWNKPGAQLFLIPLARLVVEPREGASEAHIHTDSELPFDIAIPGPTGNFSVPEIEAIYECVEHIVACFDRFF